MASAAPLLQPANAVGANLLPTEDEEGCMGKAKTAGKQGLKVGGYYCGIAVGVILLIACIGQAISFYAVTLGCGPHVVGDMYAFPGGGKSEGGGPAFNLLPQDFLLSERARTFWGVPVDVIPSTFAGSASGAQVGTWWRNSGPLFYTYTYEDIANSKLTVYMRANFWVPWMSYRIKRCDGKGPVVTLSENGYWVHNKIRAMFRMNQAQSFGIWFDGEKVAEAQEVKTGFPSLTLSNVTTGAELSSAILSQRHFHGDKDQWYVHNHIKTKLPYYITAALTLPFAFDEIEDKSAKAFAGAMTPAPTFFLEPPAATIEVEAPAALKEEMPALKLAKDAEAEAPAAVEVEAPAAVKEEMPVLKVAKDAKEEKATVTISTEKAEHHV